MFEFTVVGGAAPPAPWLPVSDSGHRQNANAMSGKHRVCVLGGGSFGSTMARIIARAVVTDSGSSFFNVDVSWFIYEEEVAAEVNRLRTNGRYLSGAVFPSNLHASSNIVTAAAGATILVVAIPSQFLASTLGPLRGALEPRCVVLSVVKSLHYDGQSLGLPSSDILALLGERPLCVLCGPNIYSEMKTDDGFAEATIGFEPKDASLASLMTALVGTDAFAARAVADRVGVEAAGALKNIVALGVGFAEGAGHGANTRAALIRVGLLEMARFARACLGQCDERTFLTEACGVGDLVLTCTAGRGHRLAARFVQGDAHMDMEAATACEQRWAELEEELFPGMKLPDWHSAKAMREFLKRSGTEASFPLLAAIGAVGYDRLPGAHVVHVLHSIVAGGTRLAAATRNRAGPRLRAAL